MKLRILLINTLIASAISSPISAAQPQKNSNSEQLMASMLPDYIAHGSGLSYAMDHEFYDTPVHLIDENNQTIRMQKELSPAHQYRVIPEGETRVTYKNIWFFSEAGTVQDFDGKEDLSKCTAQNPCSNIEQNSIDHIHALKPAANLWFTKGRYVLPQYKEVDTDLKMLRLYHKQVIMGRSPDFKQIAKKTMRPLFIGTLAWSGHFNHDGEDGEIHSVRILTKDNFLESTDGFVLSTNVYATGSMTVRSSELLSKDIIDAGNDNGEVYSAVYSSFADIADTSIDVNTNQSIGVVAGKATLYSTQINASGLSAIGVYLSDMPDTDDINLIYANYFSETDITVSGGVALGIIGSGESIIFSSSRLNTDTSFYSVGISNILGSNWNIGSTFKIHSDFLGIGIEAASCVFTSDASHLNVEIPMGGLFDLGNNELINMSTPPSRCKLNEEEEQDCSYTPPTFNKKAIPDVKGRMHIESFKSLKNVYSR